MNMHYLPHVPCRTPLLKQSHLSFLDNNLNGNLIYKASSDFTRSFIHSDISLTRPLRKILPEIMAPSATPAEQYKDEQASTSASNAKEKTPLEAISHGKMVMPGVYTRSLHCVLRYVKVKGWIDCILMGIYGWWLDGIGSLCCIGIMSLKMNWKNR
jgi:hypothetical protein